MSTSKRQRRIAVGVNEITPVAHFGDLVAGLNSLSSERRAMLGALLGATVPQVPHNMSSLRPLWADEAMQRAYDLVAMFSMLDCCGVSLFGPEGEWQIVSHLARIYSSLEIADNETRQTCSTDLRDIVRNLTELFAPIADSITLYTTIEHLSLAPLKRRALVLAAAKLVLEALRRASTSGRAARLTVALIVEWPRMASLHVMMETDVRTDFGTPGSDTVVDDLAFLLECSLDVFETAFGIHTELRFPLNSSCRRSPQPSDSGSAS